MPVGDKRDGHGRKDLMNLEEGGGGKRGLSETKRNREGEGEKLYRNERSCLLRTR